MSLLRSSSLESEGDHFYVALLHSLELVHYSFKYQVKGIVGILFAFNSESRLLQ